MKRALLLVAVLAAAVALEYALRDRDSATPGGQRVPVPNDDVELPPPAPLAASPAMVQSRPQGQRKPMVMADVVENAERLAATDATVEDDLQVVGELLRVYSRHMGSVPEGGLNEEIVACLRGKNPKKITFLGSDNAKLNPAGELVDRFGTPYYFHPVSADLIEVRSAGPDQKLWSNDDVLLD